MRTMIAIALATSLFAAPSSAQTTEKVPPIPVLPAPPPPWPEPPELVNATIDEVVEHLGQPVREDHGPISRVLDFAGDGCEVTLFFRRDADGLWRSNFIAHITPSGETINPNPCYRSIRERRRNARPE